MPLYLKLVYLLKKEYGVVHQLPKAYKFSLGQDILGRTWELIDLFIIAQNTYTSSYVNDKAKVIDKINQQFDCLKLRIRFLTELKLISLNQSAALSESIVEIGKMIGSWLKNV
jgi:hypothetical protein